MNVAKLRAKVIEKSLTTQQISAFLDINPATWYRKMANGTFTITEAKALSNKLNLSNKEIIDIFLC